MPIEGTKEFRKIQKQIKDAGSKKKIRWLYIDKIVVAIIAFVASIGVFWGIHKLEINYIYTEPTVDYNLIGQLSGK